MPSGTPPRESGRGALARDKMLRAALDLFGRCGFEATTTRMVAQQAGMNLAAIPYYFGSKEDLYEQAATWLAAYVAERMREPLSQLQAESHATDQPTALVEQVVAFMQAHARTLLDDEAPTSWVQFYMRAHIERDSAFEHLYRQVIAPSHDTVCTALGRAWRLEATHPQVCTLAFLAFHQSLSFRLTGEVLMRRLGWEHLNPARIDNLLHTLGKALRAQLQAAAQLEPTA